MANLLVISGYWPTRANTTSGIFIVEQIRAFTDLGHKVWVVIGQAIGRGKDLLSLTELGLDRRDVTLITPKFLRAPEKISQYPFFFERNVQATGACILRSIRKIQASNAQIDGALVHGLRYGFTSAPIWKPAIEGRTVALIHGVDPFLNHAQLPAAIVGSLKSGLEQIDHVAIVGTFLQQFLRDIGLGTEKARVVYNGTEVPSENELTLGRAEEADSPKRLLSVSRLIPLKGIDDTLRALAHLTHNEGRVDWQYRIIGEGEQREPLEDLAAELGISERVTFLGNIDRAATLNEFLQCDMFCLPSWAEAFGIVYLEAMARARPVVGCNNCGPADFITSGRDGILVPPKDLAALAGAIRMLWESQERLTAIGAEGRKTAENFTWKRNAREICAMLGFK